MDEATQRLIERAKQRREMLNQRASGMPEAAPRKRRTPVLDGDASESVLSEKHLNEDESSGPYYDSPKRQCLREKEQLLKPDTPAIRGVSARAQDLHRQHSGSDRENNFSNVPMPVPRKSVSSPPLERKIPASPKKSPAKACSENQPGSARKNRFAALAQEIGNWEDDLTQHTTHQAETVEEKRPKWQPPRAAVNVSDNKPAAVSSGKGRAPEPVAKVVSSTTVETGSVITSPKKHHAPPTPRSPAKSSTSSTTSTCSSPLSRNSPLRTSKVELNRSPKPFSPTYRNKTFESKSDECLVGNNDNFCEVPLPGVSKSETAISSVRSCAGPPSGSVLASQATITLAGHSNLTEKTSHIHEMKLSNLGHKPGVNSPSEPSTRPLSAKLASFEQKISLNTPKVGMSRSTHVPKTPQVCTPALSASTPARRDKSLDPLELPISQRMSKMQEKLGSIGTPCNPRDTRSEQDKVGSTRTPCNPRVKESEPTSFSVGARMSAWENMTSCNQVTDIKKVKPAEAAQDKAQDGTKSLPFSAYSTSDANPPPPPPTPPAPSLPKASMPARNVEGVSDTQTRKATVMTSSSPSKAPLKESPRKATVMTHTSPSKAPLKESPSKKVTSPIKIHSPSKLSAGTKIVQQRLAEVSSDSSTSCGSMAAQIRAARFAELNAIQNRWKNGILRDDKPSNDTKTNEPTNEIEKTSAPKASEGKREEARSKARQVFSSKLAEIGLDADATSECRTPVRPPPPQASSAAKFTPNNSGSKTHTSSIYSLIKKREEAKKEESSAFSDRVKQNNSFDDSEEEMQQKVPRTALRTATKPDCEEADPEFKKPATPVPRPEEPECDDDGSSICDTGDEDSSSCNKLSMEIDDDDISLKGFVSEAVRRESILPSPMQRRATSQSSLDSYDDNDDKAADSESGTVASSSRRGGYQPDDDDSMDDDDDDDDDSECDNTKNRIAVDDLLDEVMDDDSGDYDPDMDPNNVVMRRKQPRLTFSSDVDVNYVDERVTETEEEYDPDMDPNNVVMRRKPQPAQRQYQSVNSTTDEDENDDRPYSLQAYRKSANMHMMEPVVRASKYVGRHVREEQIEMPTASRPQRDDRRLVQDRIKELQDLVTQEQNVIMQTSNALNKCCLGNSYFAGSAEQVECNRVLLIACQKRQCYMTEIQRLKDTGVVHPEGPGPQGSLTISDIRLPLKKEFVTKIGTSQDNTKHYFILLIRNNCQVICTQMLSTHDPMMKGSLDFPNLIKINGITGNFKLTLDIYTMSISREYSKDKRKTPKKATPKKGKGYAMALESPGGPTAVRTTSFSHVTALNLNMKCLDKSSFHLDRLPFLSPLYGQIFLRQKCLMESNVEERGFLTMFDDVSGFGAWHRRWCVLSGNKLCIWKYPDDETRKDPMFYVDLKRCITEKIGLVSREFCARPNTFEMVTIRQPLRGEHDTLVTKTHNTMTTVRHQMSADSKEERIVWCNKLNRALANLRTWNADALKPMKSSSRH